MSLLQVRDLVIEFPASRGWVRALDGVSLAIETGEVLGIVGESGAGKTLTGSAIIGLIEPPGRMTGGEIRLANERIDTLPPERLRRIRGGRIGTIPQNPMMSLDPLQTVGQQLVETIRTHLGLSDREARWRAIDWLEEVGIPAAPQRFDDYPHTLSGGMRQRVAVALALCAEPSVVVADEPTTALDVSVQAQIIALLRRLTRDRGTAMMLVTHDIGVVAELADRVAVMYAGRIVETGRVEAVIGNPAHPYTAGLMHCIPPVDRRVVRLAQIDGAMPRPGAVPAGCAFHTRCSYAIERCRAEQPAVLACGGTRAACWRAGAAMKPRLGSTNPSWVAEADTPVAAVTGSPTGGVGALLGDVAIGARPGAGSPVAAATAAPIGGTASSLGDVAIGALPGGAAHSPLTAAAGARVTPASRVHAAAALMPAVSSLPALGWAGPAMRAPAIMPDDQAPLLELEHVSHWFSASAGWMQRFGGRANRRLLAVHDVTLGVNRGATLALVGESGCGKTTLARLAVGLLEPAEGMVRFDGQPVSATRANPALRRRMNMVFQDPHGSLNGRWRVRDIVAEPIRRYGLAGGAGLRDRVEQLLALVGLTPEDGARFPHAFSGGQRQRIAIARALSATPDFLVCDEPTSALDVSVQAQILNLIRDLQRQLGLTYLFISHDIAVVRQMADQVGVMYRGRIVEMGSAASVLSRPRHPYTRLLLDAAPDLASPHRRRSITPGEAANPWEPVAGCGFRSRCAFANARCGIDQPDVVREPGIGGEPDRMVACHAVQEGRAG